MKLTDYRKAGAAFNDLQKCRRMQEDCKTASHLKLQIGIEVYPLPLEMRERVLNVLISHDGFLCQQLEAMGMEIDE